MQTRRDMREAADVGDNDSSRGGGRSRGGVVFSDAPYGAPVQAPQPHRVDIVSSSQDGSIINRMSTGTVTVPGSDEEV